MKKSRTILFGLFYGAAVWAAETRVNNPSILDTGAGTGLLSAFLLQKFPKAQITLMDISENMLDVARQRFSGMQNILYRPAGITAGLIWGGPMTWSALHCRFIILHLKTSGISSEEFYHPSNPAGFSSMQIRQTGRPFISG